MRKQILFVLFSLATLSIHADEGMWMLTDLKAQNAVAMRELGLEIPIEEVYNANGLSLKDAVVHFGGGCTGRSEEHTSELQSRSVSRMPSSA